MNSPYKLARALFKTFKERVEVDGELKTECEAAIDMLRSSYNAAIYENRFIIGGALEHIVAAAMNGAGISAHQVGRGDTRIDVRARSDAIEAGFSVKQSATAEVRLINTLGEGAVSWQDPTLFLLDGVGIVYADPELLPHATKAARDALLLDGHRLKEYINGHPEYILSLRLQRPATGKIATSRTASEDVARSIIANFRRLSLP